MRSSCFRLLGAGLVSLGFALSAVGPSPAHASGPVERMVQLLTHPTDPSVIVVRYGVASEGFLFSEDGGRSFRAMCSQVIDPTLEERDKLTNLSRQRVPSAAPTLLDGQGRLLVSATLTGFYVGDGSGCGWRKDPGFDMDQWAYGIQRDPAAPEATLAAVTTRNGDATTARLMRRSADGTWSVVGQLRPSRAGETTLAGELLATAGRIYASVTVQSGSASNPTQRMVVVTSEDGGRTFREMGSLPSAAQDDVVLVALDPSEPSRVLAVNYRDPGADTLLLSEDQGRTFRPYAEVAQASGVAFAPDGRVFIADAGDQDAEGGIFTAARLGEPLTRIEGTSTVDCIGFDPDSEKLRICRRHRFGLIDPATGTWEELSRLDETESLISCPGVDMIDACETQLNSGPSWCCTGHFSFTPFCGEYDVTRVGTKTVFCGLSGRRDDEANGRGPETDPAVDPDTRDGGSSGARADAGTTRDRDPTGLSGGARGDGGGGGGGGCSVRATQPSGRSTGGALLGLGLLLVMLGRRLRRRGR